MMRTPTALLAALALALSACSRDQDASAPAAAPTTAPPTPAERVVHVYNWSDYIAEDTLEKFTAATGIRVVYDVFDGNEVLEAKLLAGRSGYDVIFPSARPFAQRHIASGIYLQLDKSKLPGLENLDPEVLAGLAEIDPGNAHVVPYMWGTTGLGYNVAKIAEILGEDFKVDSWSVLFNPEVVAKLAACGVAVLDDEQEAIAAALYHLGRDPNSDAAEDFEAAAGAYAAIRPHIRYFHSSRYIADLANGEICLAMGYSGDVLQARDRAAEAEGGVEVNYVIPSEGAIRWTDTMAIPSDAPHPNEAHAFIAFLLQPQIIADISNFVAYANPNLAATELLDESVRDDAAVYPNAEVRARLQDAASLSAEAQRLRVRTWTRVKTGQ